MARPRKYTVDTNLYIDALRTDAGKAALGAFHAEYAPFEYMSAVVAHELRAGVRGRGASLLGRALIEPFERRGRVFTPTWAAWNESGAVLAELVEPGQWDVVPRSLVNDVVLAMSCRESGIVLVTKNLRDCARINAIRAFEFVAPWPAPT